jgi:LysM repeat protein
MQITHEEAIQLIQYTADKAAPSAKEKLLHEHLKDCAQCSAYAGQFKDMEKVLQNVMRKQWSRRPAPLSLSALKEKKDSQKKKSTLLVTRTALIGMAVCTFIFLGWQVTLTTNPKNTLFPGMLPVPTPSTQYTATNTQTLNCQQILYKVQEHDTLESIASQYATSKEAIINLNNLNIETIQRDMELLIPICKSTPTSTIYPPTFTITPFLEPTTNTPG